MFARDTRESLGYTADLLSRDATGEPWTVADLGDLNARWRVSGRLDGTRAELDDVLAVMPRLRALWTTAGDDRISLLNQVFVLSRAVPRMVRHDDWEWHLHLYDDDQPLWQRLLAETAMAVSDLVRLDAADRMRQCRADGCGDPFLDESRNASRSFCSRRCSNRVAAAAYRRRGGRSRG